jgi:2-polyprenyl-3-methyl-5-hydroxy-6-metoxy-1,4-benzoquinol methylase
LNQLTDVTATFYGEGLVQAMATTYVRTPPASDTTTIIGYIKPELISAEYAALNAQLHKDNIAYGVGGGKHAPIVRKLCESLNTRSVLDYGCGKGYLAKALDFPIWEYDPAVEGKDAEPRPAELVVCTDVLEHIEPDRLDFVLADLRRVVRKVGYFTIHTGAAVKVLADGRNAHLIQEDKAWWTTRLSPYFTVAQVTQAGPVLHVVVGPKGRTA